MPAAPLQRQNASSPYYTTTSSTNTSPTSTFTRASTMPQSSSSNTSQSPTNNGGTTTPSHPLAFHQHPRQLHPPKSLLYRPAVLRTTERPVKPQQIPNSRNPLTPPPSQSPSLTSLDGDDHTSAMPSDGLEFGEGEIAGMEPIFEGNDGETNRKTHVTGPPSRAHWKPDSEAVSCDAPTCLKTFSFFERRHHCRRCGNVFCAMHTPHFLRLDQNCRFHPSGELSRACDTCYNEYRKLVQQRRNSVSSSSQSGSATPIMPSSPIIDNRRRGPLETVGSFVGSVPRDWSWSTF